MAENDSGKMDEMKGRLRKGYGEVANDDEQRQKGTVEKASGGIKQGIDKIKNKASDLLNRDKK
jgi:uncharacterized protein YjbJ (UPF0337 family)